MVHTSLGRRSPVVHFWFNFRSASNLSPRTTQPTRWQQPLQPARAGLGRIPRSPAGLDLRTVVASAALFPSSLFSQKLNVDTRVHISGHSALDIQHSRLPALTPHPGPPSYIQSDQTVVLSCCFPPARGRGSPHRRAPPSPPPWPFFALYVSALDRMSAFHAHTHTLPQM